MEATTQQVSESESKKVLSTVGREFFVLYCEDKGLLEESMNDLVELRNTTKDPRVRADIDKFIISQMIGNPKQATSLEGVGDIEITIKSRALTDEETTDRT
jgi:hypothetical protein